MKKKETRGRKPDQPRNKMIVVLREIADLTKDEDFSFRKIGKAMKIKGPTVAKAYKRTKKEFTIKPLFKVKSEVKKLSTV